MDMPTPPGVRLGRDVFIAPTAFVGGDVILADQCTVMHQVTIRGDVSPVRIGERCNIQDGAVIHTKYEVPQIIGPEVTIGHRAVVHGRRIGTGVLIGIGAIVLDDCEVGDGCIIAAGALLPPGTVIPPGQVVMGTPGRITREVSDADRRYIRHVVQRYIELGRQHASDRFPNWSQTPNRSEYGTGPLE